MMSSGTEQSTKMETSKTPLREETSTDKAVVENEEISPTEPNSTEMEAVHTEEVPVTYIDDVINELNIFENSSKSGSQTVSDAAEMPPCAEKSSSNQEDNESVTALPLQPNPLDFSVLDSGNKGCLLPIGKTFLNSYSRNYSQLSDENTDLSVKGCEEKSCMYNMLDDSESESDSATDGAVKNEKKPQGDCKDTQDTDSDEEVELCYSVVSQLQPNEEKDSSPTLHQDISGNQTDKELIADEVPQKASSHLQNSKTTDFSTSVIAPQSPLIPKSTSSESDLSDVSKHVSEKNQTVSVTQGDLSNPEPSDCKADEKIEKALAPVTTSVTLSSVSSPPGVQNNRDVSSRSHERASKMHSNELFTSDKPNTVQVPFMSTVTEPKASHISSGKTSSTQITKDTEKEKSQDSKSLFSETQTKSSTLRAFEHKTLNNNPISPSLNSVLRLEEKASCSAKLKGLSIKSKSKGLEQTGSRSARAESPSLKKLHCSPSQSPKLPAKRITPTSSPKMTRSLEKSTAVLIKTSEQSQERNASDLSNTLKANNPVKSEQRPETQNTECKSSLSKQSEAGSKCENTTTQRTFIEVRLSSSLSPSSSSAPVLPCKETTKSNLAQIQGSHPVLKENALLEQSVPKPSLGTCISFDSSVSRPEQNHSIESPTKPDDKAYSNMSISENTSFKSSKSKLYLRALDRRSYSTDTEALKRHSFSVQQRIKSFENLASFDRPVIKGIDVQSYAVGPKATVNKRLSGPAQSNENRALKRSLSSCVEILNFSCSSSLQSQNTSSNTVVMNNSESSPSSGTTGPHEEERATPEVTAPRSSTVLHTPPVLRSRNTRSNGGISRLKLRELRALSMPELDKLCNRDFSQDPGNVTFKTELEIQPARPTKSPSDNLQSTVVSRMSMIEAGSVGNGEHAQVQTVRQSCWSVR